MKMKWNKTQTILFFVWLIASIICMFLTTNSNFSIVVLGQFLFVVCLIMYNSATDIPAKIFLLPYLIICIILTIGPFLIVDTNSLLNFNILLFIISLFIAGIASVFFPIRKYNHLVKYCTYEITASIIRFEKYVDEPGEYPIFKFRYNNKDYEVGDGSIFSKNVVGSTVLIKINPNKPEEFIIDKPKELLIITVMGVIFICFSIYLFIKLF